MTFINFSFGDNDVPLKYKSNARARRLSLRFSLKESALILTFPPRTSSSQIQNFLKRCEPWIEKQLEKVSHTQPILEGQELILHGTTVECITDPLRKKPVLCHVTNTLRLPSKYKQKDLYDVFKKIAADYLIPYVEHAAHQIGLSAKKITLKDTKSRWGSCSGQKAISLSWRLILAPPEVAQYVCIHEVVHLLHMNHSKSFWEVVAELCPAYQSHRKWLKLNGPRLMQI
ncbi:MAG: M48 family metallopeptidase [Proteobacteria bacterium]|nr:M48 family metallopeptidase [Pseudomonadota bacterium]